MAQKFNQPNRASGACSVYPQFADCVALGESYADCSLACEPKAVVRQQAFRGQAGGKRIVPVRRSSVQSKNAKFLMQSGRGATMSNFLHEVGLIMVGVGAWYFIAAPLLKKAGLKPLSV